MSDKIDNFCDAMRVNLNSVEAQIERVKSGIGKAHTDSAESLERTLADAKKAVEDQRNRVEAAATKVHRWVVAKTEAGEAALQSWKDGNDRSKLETHAERAEASARSSVIIAEAALADATLATYEAIAARKHADMTVVH